MRRHAEYHAEFVHENYFWKSSTHGLLQCGLPGWEGTASIKTKMIKAAVCVWSWALWRRFLIWRLLCQLHNIYLLSIFTSPSWYFEHVIWRLECKVKYAFSLMPDNLCHGPFASMLMSVAWLQNPQKHSCMGEANISSCLRLLSHLLCVLGLLADYSD